MDVEGTILEVWLLVALLIRGLAEGFAKAARRGTDRGGRGDALYAEVVWYEIQSSDVRERMEMRRVKYPAKRMEL